MATTSVRAILIDYDLYISFIADNSSDLYIIN